MGRTGEILARVGARLLPRAIQGPAALEPGSRGAGFVSGFLGVRGAPPRRTTRAFLDAYSEQPYLRAVGWKIATNVAAARWRVFAIQDAPGSRTFRRMRTIQREADPFRRRELLAEHKTAHTLVEFDDHPFLELVRDANPWHVGVAAFRLVQLYLDLTGESFSILERDPDRGNVPVRWWPVPGHWIESTPTPEQPFFEVSVGTATERVPFTEMLWICEPDPVQPYGRGKGTAQALGDELDTSEHIAKFVSSFFWNQARPDLIISGKDDNLTRPQTSRLESYWDDRHRGFWKAFRPLFLRFRPEITQIQKSMEALQIDALSKSKRESIISTFGIPPEMLGILTNSNRATISAAREIMAETVLVPRLELLRANFQERLAPEYDERLIIDYDSPTPRDREHQLEVMKEAPWAWTVDQWRASAGDPPLEDEEAGALHALPFNLTFERLSATPAPARLGEGPRLFVEPGDDAAALLSHPEDDDDAKFDNVDVPLDDPFYILIHRIADRLEPKVRRQFIETVDALVGSISAGQLSRLEASLRARDVDAAIRSIPIPVWRAALEGLVDPLREAVGAAGVASAQEAADSLGITFEFDAVNPRAVAWAQNRSLELAKELSEETEAAIRSKIVRSLEGEIDARALAREILGTDLGLTTGQLRAVDRFRARLVAEGRPAAEVASRAESFAKAMLRRRATTIARTETINASSAGQQVAWEEGLAQGELNNKRSRKVWFTTPDDRLDAVICEPMPFMPQNANVPINGFFTVGDGSRKVKHPTAHPSCRCGFGLEITSGRGMVTLGRLSRAAVAFCAREPEDVTHFRAWPEDARYAKQLVRYGGIGESRLTASESAA